MPLRGLGNRLKESGEWVVRSFWNEFRDGLEILVPLIWPHIRTGIRESAEVISDVATALFNGFLRGWELNKGLFEHVLTEIGQFALKPLKGGRATHFDAFAAYINNGTFDPQVKEAILKYFHQSNDIAEFLTFLSMPSAIMNTILSAETQTYVERTRQKDLAAERITTLDLGSIMQMWQRDGVSRGELSDHLARQGLPNSVAAYLDAATTQYLPLVQLAVAAQRSNGNTGALSEAATNLGFPPSQVQAAIIAAKEFPPINMLALAAQKGGLPSSRISEVARSLGYTEADVQAAIASVKGDSNLAMLAIAAQHGDVSAASVSEAARKQGLTENDAQAALSAAKAFAPLNLLALALQRKGTSREHLDSSAKAQGLEAADVQAAISAARLMLTPITLIEAKWRGEITDGEYVSKMAESGYSGSDAKIFESVAEFLPTPSDLISWISKEVFEPDSITKYGLDDEFDRLDLTLFAKIGINKEQARNYWVSHWQHPSFTQVGEMFVRDILTSPDDRNRVIPGSTEWAAVRSRAEEEVYEWMRLVEVPPYWRRRMTAMLYQPYTRVDIRRMWDLDVVGDDEVVRAYLDQGYDIEHAQNLLAFTKVERGYPDIIARYKNGWIGKGDVLSELISYGISPETADRLYQRKFQNLEQPQRIATERDLTKTEILKGYKLGYINLEQTVLELMRLGYDEFEAEFIAVINTEFTSSPDTPLGFRKGTELYRKATGQTYIDIPDSIIELERAMINAQKALNQAKETSATTNQIVALESAYHTAKARFDIEYRRLKL